MADFPLDWSAGQSMNPDGPLGVVNSGYKGALTGFELGQKGATIHALQGIDINSPKSVDAGIGALVRANAGEQASALQNLSFTRWLRQQIPDLLKDMGGSGGDQTAQPPDAAQHALETFGMAKDAADKLAQTPQAERPAAFAKIKQDMMARGIPEQAIDAAGKDLSDAGLKSLSDHYAQLMAHGQYQMSPEGEAPPMPSAHPSNTWYDNVVASPKIPLAAAMLKGAGLDITPYLETAKALAMPRIAKEAEAQYAGQIAQSAETAKKGVEIAGAPALAVIKAWEAGKIKDAELPALIRKAQAEADIAAQHSLTKVDETDAQGNPTGRTTQERTDRVLARGGPIGRSQSPGEAKGQQADADAFMEAFKRDGNQQAIQIDLNARDTATAAMRMAQSADIKPSNLLPWAERNTNTLQAFGFDKKQANNLAAYRQLVDTQLKNAIQVFPRNQAEFHAIASAVADSKVPGDAAALSFATIAAIHDRAAQEKQFRQAWGGAHEGKYSEIAYQHDASQQPWANRSIFSDPVFQGLKFNGKPVVVLDKPQPNGRQWGYFMPYGANPTPFRVK